MDKIKPSSITIEEAVARMVNQDYIPTGCTLPEMTAAFLEEAEVDYENARIDGLPETEIKSLQIRMESCKARHLLTILLLESLQEEIKKEQDSMIVLAGDASSQCRITLESIADWASDRYGIGIPEWTPEKSPENEALKNVCWSDITIKIWRDYNIGLFIKGKDRKKTHFRKIELMGMAKSEPNQLGGILVGLSLDTRFLEKRITPQQSTAISKLRRILCKWVGLSGDPFEPYIPETGLKPKFTIINDESNAAERIEKRSTTHEENRSYTEDNAGSRKFRADSDY